MWRDDMQYFGSTGDLKMESYQQWDSVTSTWIQYYYEHFSAPGQEDESFEKYWNPVTRKYDYGYRYTFQYDLSGNQTENLYQEMDTATSLWVNYSKDSSRYGSSGIIEDILIYWDTATSSWDNYQKTEYTYDASDFLTETRWYSWYLAWNLSGRSVYTNNGAGKPTGRLDESWNGASWDTTFMIQYTYDAGDTNILTMLERSYNTGTHTWTNRSNFINTYFPNGTVNTTLSQIWNTISNEWMSWGHHEYDAFGNSIDQYYLSINPTTFEINYGSRYLDTYDVNNRFLMDIYQRWNTVANTWDDVERIQDTYEDPVNSYYIEELGTMWDGTNWINEYKDVFFWSYPSGIENHQNQNRLCFYENPMEQGKPVNCPSLDPSKIYQFDLFSMKGEKIYSEPVAGGTFVINCRLSSGNYLLRISENGKTVYRDKLIVIN
jgi:hypothetical protein